jgi:hypothetical protein
MNKTAAECLTIRRSKVSNKWAVDLDLPSGSRRIDVFFKRKDAEAELIADKQVLVNYTAEQLADPVIYAKAFREMIVSSTGMGIVSDDEPIAVWHRTENNWLIIDTSDEALKPERRLWREFGLLSDQAWDHATKPSPGSNKAKGFG